MPGQFLARAADCTDHARRHPRRSRRQHGDFYVPRFEIRIEGVGLAPDVLRDVTQVTYNDKIKEIDSFELTVNNWDPATREFKYVGAETKRSRARRHGRSAPVRSVQRRKSSCASATAATLSTIMRGSTTTLEPTFPERRRADADRARAQRAAQAAPQAVQRHWTNKRISEIAKDIGRRKDRGKKRFPMPILISDKARRKEPKLAYVAQDNQYDIDFLLLEARKIGYVVYVDHEPAGKGAVREVLRFRAVGREASRRSGR